MSKACRAPLRPPAAMPDTGACGGHVAGPPRSPAPGSAAPPPHAVHAAQAAPDAWRHTDSGLHADAHARQRSHAHASTSGRQYMLQPAPTSIAAQQPSPPWFSQWGPWHVVGVALSLSTLLLATALMTVARMFHPVAKAAERALREMELASAEMQSAAAEVEAASRVMEEELPHTLEAMEDASREMEEVGEAMGAILGPFRGASGKTSSKRGVVRRRAAAAAVRNGAGGTSDDAWSSDSLDLSDSDGAHVAAHEMTNQLATAVHEGRAGSLPLRLLSSMSKNVGPLLTEWRDRIRNVSRGLTPGLYVPSTTAAATGVLSDTEDEEAAVRGLGEPGVSQAIAGVRNRMPNAPLSDAAGVRGTSMQVQRTPSEGGVMLHVALASPTGAPAAAVVASVERSAPAHHDGAAAQAVLQGVETAAEDAAAAALRCAHEGRHPGGKDGVATGADQRTVDVREEERQRENITCDGMVPGLPAAARVMPKAA